MNLAAPQARKATRPATPERSGSSCDCDSGHEAQAAAGLPRFLARHGAGTTGCGVQAKLAVGRQDDPFEREADALAQAVVQGEPVSLPGTSGAAPAVQRKCDQCAAEADEQVEGALVQRAADPGAASSDARAPEPAVDAGSPLEPPVRSRLEASLGADLGDVRVHSGPGAQGMARALHAKAFTHGEHIWLGPQQRADDLPLIAHEVAHVIQQGTGRARPEAVQRAPADYRHPEDGDGVMGRMQAKIAKAREGHEDEQPTGDATAQKHQARNKAGGIDRGKVAQEKAKLQPQAKPSVDRPAQEAPKVQEAAAQTQQEAESPAEPIAEGKGKPGEPAGGGKKGSAQAMLADGGAGQAQSMFSTAEGLAMPSPEVPVVPPMPVSAPVDAGGQPLPGDPGADAHIAALAQEAQSMRDESARIRSFATEERRNAQTLRGNLALVRGGVMQAELGVNKSRDHLTFREGLLGQARQGLAISEQKAATVAAEAPGFQEKADEGKAESGPMRSEASSLASENAANTPDDEEAAANAREQGASMNQAGSDIGTTDDAVTQTRTKAASLGQDAAQAQQKNAATQGKIDGMQATLGATSDKLGQMGEQTGAARGEMEGLASAPDRHTQQASNIDQRGQDIAATSQDVEQRLQAAQTSYAADMAAVPAPEPWTREKVIELYGEEALGGPSEEEEAPAPAPAPAPEMLVQRTPADSGEVEAPPAPPPAPDAGAEAGAADAGADAAEAAPPPDAGADAAAGAEAPDAAAADAGEGAAAGSEGGTDEVAGAAPEGEALPAATPAAPPERIRVDAAGAVSEALPSWLTGVEPPNEEARQRAQQEAAERREAQIRDIQGANGDGFSRMSATDKMGWALRQTGRNLFGSVGNIKWPGWGHLALGLIDPRGPMMGVVSGLGMMLSGGANLFSAEQWRRDPLGNLLKSAADIATGLTIVLGSITALAGVIIAIMTAITILSFGTAAPVTGPVIAFCTTVLTTVGGWTIAVGKVALVLQALVFIKNLIDAACAETAEQLVSEADQMTENVSDAGNVLMQMGMAKAGQMGGRAAAAEIRAAGGGVRYAAQMGARAGVGVRAGISATGRGIRALPSAAMRGARALPGAVGRGLRAAPGAIGRGTVAAGRAIGRGTVAGARAIGRGTVAGARAIGRGTMAGARAIGRGTMAAGRAVGRGATAFARGARALPGAVARGVRALPGAVARGVRGLPGAIRGMPGAIGRGARGAWTSTRGAMGRAWSGAREYFGKRFSRDFIVGEDIPNLSTARSVAAEARADVWAKARAPGGPLAGEARVAGAADDVHAPAAADEAVPNAAETRARVEETPPASGAEREASVSRSSHMESEQITPREAANEVAFVDEHPNLVEGRSPNQRARLGEHEIVEVPGGGCVRRSGPGLPIPCPDCFSTRQRQLYTDFVEGLQREGVDMQEAMARFGFKSEEEMQAFFRNVSSERDLAARLRTRMDMEPGAATDDVLAHHREATASPDVAGREEMGASSLRRDDPRWSAQASAVESSGSFGRAAEHMGEQFLANNFDDVSRQVRIRPILDNGQPANFYFIADNVGTSRIDGRFIAFDSKLTAGAPFTERQLAGYPLLARNGGIVESRGASMAYGTTLPPTSTFRLQPRFNVRPRPGVPDINFGAVQPTADFFRLAQSF